MAFGAFDGIHTGHIYYLKEAKKLGDYLIVGIGRDNAHWKFPRKYQLSERERKKLVQELGIADEVHLGSTKDSLANVKKIKPDVIAITPYHPVDKRLLQMDLLKRGLKTKVVCIKLYKRNFYDPIFRLRTHLTREDLMGLPPKKVD